MTHLVLIRHGETEWNARGLYQGQLDSPLTDEGLAQAERMGERMRHHSPIAALYASDLARTHATAAPTALALGLEIVAEPDLGERGYGIFQGIDKSAVQDKYPEEYTAHLTADPDYVVPGGESTRQFHTRVVAALDRLGQRHWGEQIAVVTHGGVLTAIFNHILGLAINAPRNFAVPNTGYNLVSDTGDGWRIETMGDISHLQGGALDDIA